METRKYNKIQYYKFRFVNVLNFLGTTNTKLAAKEIAELPDYADNGYEDAYLTAKLLQITLTYITKSEFDKFENDDLRLTMLHALFAESDAEDSVQESMDNVFVYCEKNPEEDLEETLENCLGGGCEYDESIHDNLKLLKSSCDSFIQFYEKHSSELNKSLDHFTDNLTIEDFHKGPLVDGFKTKSLSHPDQKHIIESNGKLIINNMEPCLGLVIIAENNDEKTACLGYHVFPRHFIGENKSGEEVFYADRLLSFIQDQIKSLKDKGYSQQTRFFFCGGNISSFPLALDLIMLYWQENTKNHFAHADFYLVPSAQHSQTFSYVKLKDNQCSIVAGGEYFDHDEALCKERNIEYEGDLLTGSNSNHHHNNETSSNEEENEDEDESSSYDTGRESTSSDNENIVQNQKRKWMTFYSSSSDDDNDIQPIMKKRHYK